jgi:hypothetical protein
VLGFWILFSTQLGLLDSLSRLMTDLLWSGSQTLRSLGSVRGVYYGALGAMTACGVLSLGAPLVGWKVEPIVLLQLGANWAGVNFVILALQTLRVNRTLLPPELRPSLWREILLGVCALFFLASTSAWLFFSEEAKLVTPYAVSFLLIAFLVGLGVGGRKEPTADR